MKGDLLVSKGRVKMFLKNNDVRVSKDFYKALDKSIRELLLKAIERAKSNGRSTMMGYDF